MTHIQTSLIESLTSDLILMVHRRLSVSLVTAMKIVYGSDTFRALCDVKTELYKSSAMELYSILEDEKKYGKLVSSL